MNIAAGNELNVLIATFLEPECVNRIADVDPCINVIYRPDLLPVPRYPADHDGTPRDLSTEQILEWKSYLRSADITFGFDWYCPRDLPSSAPRLQWVQATSSGIGEFVVKSGLTKVDVLFTTAAGVHAEPLAEFVALSLFYFTKDVPQLRRRMTERDWKRHATRSVAGLHALVVGMGQIGRRTARQLEVLGVTTTGVSRHPGEVPPGFTSVIPLAALDDALPHADAVVLCAPLTPHTYHLIGERQLALMPRRAILINVARGPLIDERSLVCALKGGRLRGAALDVVEEEPLDEKSGLWRLENALVSAHSAGTLANENEAIVDIFVDNLHRWLRGDPLHNSFSLSESLYLE